MHVDIAATSREEVGAAGVDLLDAVTSSSSLRNAGSTSWVAEAIGDRFGCVTLVGLLNQLQKSGAKVRGTLTVAFVSQQWTGGRGLGSFFYQRGARDTNSCVPRAASCHSCAGATPSRHPTSPAE